MIVSIYFSTVAPELFGSMIEVEATVSTEVSITPEEEETSVSVLPIGGVEGRVLDVGVVLLMQPAMLNEIMASGKMKKTGTRKFFMVWQKFLARMKAKSGWDGSGKDSPSAPQ